MAVIHVEFCAGTDYQYPGTPRLSETVANGTGSGASELGEIVIVTNTGETDAYVAIGTAPDTGARQQNGSVTSARMLLQAGDMRVVGGALTATDLPVGSRVACADVPSGLAVPPTLSASASLSGRTLTLTVDSLTGTPTPAVQLTELTLNGVDVRAEATGSGPWVYVIPNSTEAQNVTWELTATNAAGSDTAAGSEMVAAYIVAPDRMEAPSLEVIGTDTIRVTLGNERSNGGAPIQSYDLRYRQDRGSWQIVPDVTNPFDLGGLTPGASVDIQNRADNGTASSLWSSHANATTWRAPVAAVTSTPGAPGDGQHIAASDVTYNETTAGNPDTTVYSRGLTVDGGAFQTLEDGDVTMSEGEVIRHALRIQHAQSATDTVLTSAASTVGTAPVAPSATLNVTRSGRTVTAWLTDVTGSPDPLPATLDRFDAAGVDVRGSVGGSGTAAAPWTYAVPASASDTPIVITARLENGVGTGWSGSDSSITIPANLFAPAISGLPTISGTERVGETLTATPAPVTGAPVPATTWQWERGGTPIAGATASAYTLVSADAGQTLTVVQLATSPQGSDSAESATTGAIGAALAAPTVTATDSLTGRTLTIAVQTLTGNPAPSVGLTSLTLAGRDVSGDATGIGPWSYVVPDSAANRTVTWSIAATNSQGTDTATGAETVAANLSLPQIAGTPSIGGTERVGETLTATPASVTGTPTPTRTWQWERGGTPISGATASTYTPTSADAGQTLTVVQTETNSQGTDSAESAATGTVAQVAAGTITFTPGAYLRNADGTNPSITNTDIVTTDTTGPYFLDILTVTNGTTPSQTDMNTGSGSGVLEKVSLGPQAVVENLGGTMDLSVSITNGRIYQQYRDSSGVVSALTSITPADVVTYDAVAPTFSGAEIGAVDPVSLIVTLDKAVFGSTSALDWDVQVAGAGATETTVSFTPGGTAIDVTLGAAVTSEQTVTVAYTGTGLVGADAEPVATFTAQSVTNNVTDGSTTGRSAVARNYVDSAVRVGGVDTSTTFTPTSLGNPGDGDVVVFVASNFGPQAFTGCRADGNALSLVASYQNPFAAHEIIYCYKGACPSSSGDIVVSHANSSRSWLTCSVYRVANAVYASDTGDEGNGSLSNNVNTVTDGAVFYCVQHLSTNAMSLTGVTSDGAVDDGSSHAAEVGSALTTGNETPRTVTATISGYGSGLAVSFAPA